MKETIFYDLNLYQLTYTDINDNLYDLIISTWADALDMKANKRKARLKKHDTIYEIAASKVLAALSSIPRLHLYGARLLQSIRSPSSKNLNALQPEKYKLDGFYANPLHTNFTISSQQRSIF